MSGGKTYQVTQVDPLNPHTKGMVYQVSIVGGFTQIKEMPEASADNVGIIYQYIGETDSNFTHGFFYESQALGTTPETYGWVAINVQQGGANTDLSNLTATGANIGNWTRNASNCAIKSPQDINLTLSNGTLTLKAGSKVYVPNGVNTFDTINIANDISTVVSGISATIQLFVVYRGGSLTTRLVSGASSGATNVNAGQAWNTWYDTTNNIIHTYGFDGTTDGGACSLPVAIVNVYDGAISSIDQVFNGFGYIGSTLFTLPGVECLRMNGKNSDGTLKSSLTTISSVKTYTFDASVTGFKHIVCYDASYVGCATVNFRTYPTAGQITMDIDNNLSYQGVNVYPLAELGGVHCESGKITKMFVKPLLDVYLDSHIISNYAMPSDRYIGLTGVSSSPTTFIAPADGYISFIKIAVNANEQITLEDKTSLVTTRAYSTSANNFLRICLPVSKGDIIEISWTATGATQLISFTYTNGSK